MGKYTYNPYDFINPVRNPKLFAGRRKELEEIEYYLNLSKSDSPKYFHLSLVGPRSVGKTSLLNMIEHMANELGLLAVKIPLNAETVKDDVLFFKEVIDGTLTKGAEKGMYDGLTGKVYKAFRKVIDMLDIEAGAKAKIPFLFGTVYVGFKKKQNIISVPQPILIHDLKKIYNEAKSRGILSIVLLFDECDLLSQNEVILQKIRNIFMEIEGYILVFSGTDKMYSAISDVFSPIPRFFKRINVENFKDMKETEECLLKPLSDEEKKDFDRACIGEIHRIANGSPYEINLIAHYMYRRWKDGTNTKIQLSPEVLDDVLNELERLRKEEHHKIASKIKRLWNDQLKILISLLEFPRVPKSWLSEYMLLDEIDTLQLNHVYSKKSITQNYVEQLKNEGIITEENGKVSFKGGEFDILYLKYLCTSKGIRDSKEFFVGFPDDPLWNINRKLIEGVFLKGFQEYYIHTAFDKSGKIDKKTGQKFVIGAKVHLPPGEHKIFEISPKTQEEFYLGAQNSIRFRVNIEWMNMGFVTQVKFKKEEDLKRFANRLDSLKDKLDFLGYKILLKDEILWNVEGTEYLKQGKTTEAIECFDKAIEINPLFELPWANKGNILFKLGKYEDALECINKALELSPNWAEALKLKGMILINLKRNEEALECLEKAKERNPEDWSIWDNLGRASFNIKMYDKAISYFDKSLKLNPNNPEVLYLKGLSFINLGKIDKVLNCFDKALQIDSEFIPALLAKGKFLLEKGEYNKAIDCFDSILRKDPHNINTLVLKGLTLYKLEQFEDAIKCCNKILEIDQNNAIAWYNKACFKARLGFKDEAITCLRKAIELDASLAKQAATEGDFKDINKDSRFCSLLKIFDN